MSNPGRRTKRQCPDAACTPKMAWPHAPGGRLHWRSPPMDVAAVRIWHVQWNIMELIHYIRPSSGALQYNLWYTVWSSVLICLSQWKPRTPRSVLGIVDLAHIQGVLFGNADIRACVKPSVTDGHHWDMSFIKCHLIGFGLSMFTTFQKLPWFVPLINLILIAGVSVVSCRISQNGCITL